MFTYFIYLLSVFLSVFSLHLSTFSLILLYVVLISAVFHLRLLSYPLPFPLLCLFFWQPFIFQFPFRTLFLELTIYLSSLSLILIYCAVSILFTINFSVSSSLYLSGFNCFRCYNSVLFPIPCCLFLHCYSNLSTFLCSPFPLIIIFLFLPFSLLFLPYFIFSLLSLASP